MAHINLLPWRAEVRKQKQQEFLVLAVLVALAGFFVIFLAHSYMENLIDYQQSRNRYLQNEIVFLNHKIQKIKKLDATKKALLNRMKIIEELQASRPGVVHLFNQLVTTEPPGLYLTHFVQKHQQIKLSGRADSNARVSAYMRRLDHSPWFQNAKLVLIVTKSTSIGKVSDFHLTVEQAMPKAGKAQQKKKGS
ncbi:PilN domain-containing protein [Acidihalobacter prosperus]